MVRSHPTRPASFPSLAAAALAAAVACAFVAPAHATYSILARDPTTGEIGAAVQSHWFQVHHVLWVEPGVGAVATQSLTDFTYGPAGLEMLAWYSWVATRRVPSWATRKSARSPRLASSLQAFRSCN